MQSDLGQALFTFAVISDSHVNEGEARCASPFASNKLANARFRAAVHEVNRHDPAFTVHLGDMANPLPELATFPAAVENFKTLVAPLRSPLHLVAGNHCVGDKPTGWVPVPRICEESLVQYEATYGSLYGSFDHGPCHFVILCSLIVNFGGEREEAQRRWLEDDLRQARDAGRRIWVMMHYPLYIAAPEEPGSYDNVDEPGRSWLLELFARYGVEAAYSGHVHNYFYNRHGETRMYTLPALSFVRQDYGELYSVAPNDDEGGRDDHAKLGFLLVTVHEHGHVNRLVRTLGRTLAPDQAPAPAETLAPAPAAPWHLAPVGAEMRQNWLSRVALMTNNSVSPFTRRWARNDWPVAALEEMGITRVRLFLDELAHDDVPERMADLQALGFDFVVYSYGLPTKRDYDLIRRHHDRLAGWELIMSLELIDQVADGMTKLALKISDDDLLPCYLNEVIDIRRGQSNDANVRHIANYGFQPDERERIARLSASEPIAGAFQGLVFRLRRRGDAIVSPWTAIREIDRMAETSGMRHQVHVLFAGNITAERFVDDLATANRVAEAMLASVVARHVDVVLDTFEDSDRGYFVRNGLVDRRYDPRLAARVLEHLNAALAEQPIEDAAEATIADLAGGRVLSVAGAHRALALVMPRLRCEIEEIAAPDEAEQDSVRLLDLDSGTLSAVGATLVDRRLRLERPSSVASPHLVLAG